MKDWREDYVICVHVAADEAIAGYRVGSRCSCGPCMEKGFLNKDLVYESQGKLTIGKFKKEVA